MLFKVGDRVRFVDPSLTGHLWCNHENDFKLNRYYIISHGNFKGMLGKSVIKLEGYNKQIGVNHITRAPFSVDELINNITI